MKTLTKTLWMINLFSFRYIFIVAFLVSIIESYKYIGFIQKHFFIPSPIIYIVCFVSFIGILLQQKTFRKIAENAYWKFFLRFGSTLFLFLLLVYEVLNEVEIIYYHNFSYYAFHIQPANLIYPVLILIQPVILYFLTSANNTKGKKNEIIIKFKNNYKLFLKDIFTSRNHLISSFLTNTPQSARNYTKKQLNFEPKLTLKTWPIAISAILVLGFGLYNATVGAHLLFASSTFIISHLNWSYNQKMENKWGFLYRMVELVENNSPDGSQILYPPEVAPFALIGNTEQVRYFFGNRKLENAKDLSTINGSPDFVLIAKGGLHPVYDAVKDPKEYGWPKVFVPAKRIWYLDSDNGNITEVKDDYDPKKPENNDAWGLIEVDKDRL